MTQTDTQPKTGGGSLLQAMISLGISLVVMLAAMFLPAGTWDWPRGWIFFGVFCAFTVIACIWIWNRNPELFAARSRIQKGTKAWDVPVTIGIILSFAAILPVSALDDARFHWAPQPDSIVWLGHVLFAIGYMGTAWAQSENRHFEATVRIQTDRGHHVIDTGPYAFIRHPGYAFAIPMMIGMPLALGSLYGLIPAFIAFGFLLIRTLGEDATLKAELPGYRDYAARVKQRWLPGIW
jgi:protein-S-isoprenylcysteine O-methyltransferase Ste14